MTARESAITASAADIVKHLSAAQRRALLLLQDGPSRLRTDVATCLMRRGLIDRRCQCFHTYGLTYEGMKVAVEIENNSQELTP